jgi:hypothetical protein
MPFLPAQEKYTHFKNRIRPKYTCQNMAALGCTWRRGGFILNNKHCIVNMRMSKLKIPPSIPPAEQGLEAIS